jgi:prepilin-type N-terminal cleavage/methylation domain-containing protein
MKGKKIKSKKGFTLIELLVVIAIIAILSVVVILTLNPAELLRQSRDSNRISDFSVMKSAVAFYLASVSTPVIGTSTWCYQGIATASSSANGCGSYFLQASGTLAGAACTSATCFATSTSRAIDGTGWIPIPFSTITAGGSPISQLPIDPTNSGNNFYAYEASSTGLVFKMATQMESQKYSASGTNDVVSTDGGINNNMYEQGSNVKM